MGDALAAALMVRGGFTAEDFAGFHPGGALGARLLGSDPDASPPPADDPHPGGPDGAGQ